MCLLSFFFVLLFFFFFFSSRRRHTRWTGDWSSDGALPIFLGAPHLFGMEIGFNLPAFIIALVITAVLVVGIKESARFNATIVTIKVGVVLFVIALEIGRASCRERVWV